MNYSLVKQFANNSIDNFFNFFYKWVDFFKVLVEMVLAFVDIWVTFFQIFYNAYLYVYYLLLFGIDKSAESSGGLRFWRKIPKRVAYSPSKVYVREISNPVPGMYGKKTAEAAQTAAKASTQTVKDTMTATVKKFSTRPRGVKTDRMKKTLEFFAAIVKSIKNFIMAPVRSVAEFIVKKMKPVRSEEPAGSKSLIDEYMREYEQRRRA